MGTTRKALSKLGWSLLLAVTSGATGLLGVGSAGCGGADYGPSPNSGYGKDAAYGPPACSSDEDCTRYSSDWYCNNGHCEQSEEGSDGGEDAGL